MTEAQFQASVIELAELQGWRVYHVAKVKGQLRATTSLGYPDLTMVRGTRLIFAELKTEIGRVTDDQEKWLNDLQQVSDFVEAYAPICGPRGVIVTAWRPSDWPDIEQALKR